MMEENSVNCMIFRLEEKEDIFWGLKREEEDEDDDEPF